jgi:hypothetical protein
VRYGHIFAMSAGCCAVIRPIVVRSAPSVEKALPALNAKVLYTGYTRGDISDRGCEGPRARTAEIQDCWNNLAK